MCNGKIECIDIFEEEEGEKGKFVKKCPECGGDQLYTTKYTLLRAIKSNSKCDRCSREERKLSFIAKEIRKKYKKQYRQLPMVKKMIKETNRKYNQLLIVKKKHRERRKKERKDIMKKLSDNMSSHISYALKSKNISKNNEHWETLIINTKEEIIEHWKKHFLPGMTLKNYGKKGWVNDHIIPISFFDYTSTDDVEFKYCWSIDNFQPLWKEDNLKKGDRMILWGKK